jgi:hypothetical protein
MLIIYADGGLGNRVSSLCNGLSIARIFNVSHRLFWPTNESCQLDYAELFDEERFAENKNKLDIRALEACSLLSLDNFLNLPDEFFLNPWQCLGRSKVLAWIGMQIYSGRTVIVFGHRIFPQLYKDVVLIMHREVTFNSRILSLVCEMKKKLPKSKSYFGIHYRGTDGQRGTNYRSFTTFLISLLSILSRKSIFLATDDTDYVRFVRKNFPNVYIIDHTRPKKRIANLSWSGNVLDSNLEIHPYNVNRDGDSVVCSACDLVLLSESNWLCLNSYSTFLEFAGLYSRRRICYWAFRLINRLKHFKVLIKSVKVFATDGQR